MKQGTVSVLFGAHSIIHSLLVVVAWRRLYKHFPCSWELVCIFLHDIGHWGKDYLNDYEEKRHHAELGARVAEALFGERGHKLVFGHNAYIGSGSQSRLYQPDKYSWIIAPIWWIWLTEVIEPKLVHPGRTRIQSARNFKYAMYRNWVKGLPKQGHDIYLEMCNARESLRS